MNDAKTVCVVVPIYKKFDEINLTELRSLQQCFRVLGTHEIYLVGPTSLNFEDYLSLAYNHSVSVRVKRFSDTYFESIGGYNKLMLSINFYRSFSSFEYILVYQTDAWVFKDNLKVWCNKSYDYVGAPWVDWEWSTFAAGHMALPRTILSKLGYKRFNLVGNGGLSLRKVKSFVFNLKLFNKAALNCTSNEDYFYSFYVTSFNPFFRIPNVKEALSFSFDENPDLSFQIANSILPMGCHAWPKYKSFWSPFIDAAN